MKQQDLSPITLNNRMIEFKRVTAIVETIGSFISFCSYLFGICFLWIYPLYLIFHENVLYKSSQLLIRPIPQIKDHIFEIIIWLWILLLLIGKIVEFVNYVWRSFVDKRRNHFSLIEKRLHKRAYVVSRNNKFGLYDIWKANYCIPPQYDNIEYLGKNIYVCTKGILRDYYDSHGMIVYHE